MTARARLALTDAGDIDLSSGKMVLETDAGKSVTAKVRKVLNLWQASWFLAAGDGVPWIQQVLAKKNPDLRLVENVIRSAVLGIEEIVSVASIALTFDRTNRALAVNMQLTTTVGAVPVKTTLAVP